MPKRKSPRALRRPRGTRPETVDTEVPADTSGQNPHERHQNLVAVHIDNLPPDQRREQIRELLEIKEQLVSVQSKSFSGPIPPPEDLKQYQEILPDAPERILAMAEKTLGLSEQNLHIENRKTTRMLANDRIKIYGSILLGLTLLILAGIAVWRGDAYMALPLGLAGIVAAILRPILEKIGKTTTG